MKSKAINVFRLVSLSLAISLLSAAALAQSAISVDVDATDAPRNLLHVRERVTVTPGVTQLFYPKWIPGEHSPTGTLNNMVNLHIRGGGKEIPWERDDVEMFAIRLNVPRGVTTLDVTFDDAEQPGTVGSANLTRIKWNRLLLYPRSVNQERIMVTGSLTIPAGWKYATALQVNKQAEYHLDFRPATLERFIDSPAMIGKYFVSKSLAPAGDVLHEIDIVADTQEALNASDATLQGWQSLVGQARKMFGARHYGSYRFLLSLSDVGGSEGLEHHESSEDGVSLSSLTDPEGLIDLGDLLGHEYAHSWNGKYRRPAGLATPDFEQPMKGELLWIYEGLTQYLGNVLPARSGLWTPEVFRETVAMTASLMDARSGRSWRPLADTARAVQFTYSGPRLWQNERRSADYYYEGLMIWLEADVLIRERTGGKKSLDDFLHAFHGGTDTGPVVRPYTLSDVVATLNSVAPYDWNEFFKRRVYDVEPKAPLGGITGGGWRFEYNETPNLRIAAQEKLYNFANLMYSIGASVTETGEVRDVTIGSAAWKAGLAPGIKIRGRGGKDFVLDDLKKTVADSKTTQGPILIDVDNGGVKQTLSLDYHGGAKYPHLIRDSSKPDLLSDIIKGR